MIARLSGVLAIPLREVNSLLIAAGYAPSYPETALRKPSLEPVRRAIDLILKHQEPYPAFVLDRHWEILETNQAAVRMNQFLLDGRRSPHSNMLLQFFDPEDLRSVVSNWEEVAGDLLRHLQEAVRAAPSDEKAREVLEAVRRYPGIPDRWMARDLSSLDPAPPLLTVSFSKGGRELRFFSTITTFGTANDVTVEELRIECAFPGDESTEAFCREL